MAYTWRFRLEEVPFLKLQVYEGKGISVAELYERVGKSVISVCKKV